MVNSYIGVCRFCGQQAILEIDKEEWTCLTAMVQKMHGESILMKKQ